MIKNHCIIHYKNNEKVTHGFNKDKLKNIMLRIKKDMINKNYTCIQSLQRTNSTWSEIECIFAVAIYITIANL